MKKNEQLYALAGKYGKDTQIAFLNSMTGTVNEANAKLLRTAPETFAMLTSPVKDVAAIMNTLATESKTYMDEFGGAAARIGASSDFGLGVSDLMKGLAYSKLSHEERVAQAEKDTIVTDQSTTSMTKLIDTQKNTTIQLQAMANAAFKHVVPAFQVIADVAHEVAKTARETLGVGMGGVSGLAQKPSWAESTNLAAANYLKSHCL